MLHMNELAPIICSFFLENPRIKLKTYITISKMMGSQGKKIDTENEENSNKITPTFHMKPKGFRSTRILIQTQKNIYI